MVGGKGWLYPSFQDKITQEALVVELERAMLYTNDVNPGGTV